MQERRATGRGVLLRHLEALEIIEREIEQDRRGGVDSARRIARSLIQTLRSDAPAAVVEAVDRLTEAPEDQSAAALADVLRAMRAMVSGRSIDKLRILVIEDEPIAARLLQSALAGPSREIVLAPNADSAERLVHGTEFDLIILDLFLPDSDGRNVMLELRGQPATRTTPIVVVSGTDDPAIQIECYALGADQFFTKPVDPHLLAAAASVLLHRDHTQREEALVDPVTGLANRVAFDEAYRRAAASARRSGQPMTLAALELEEYEERQALEDSQTPDDWLARNAREMAACVRRSDLLARWSGAEFVLLLPETALEGARTALGKIQQHLDRKELHDGLQSRGPYFSAGLLEVSPDLAPGQALVEAERALYHARQVAPGAICEADEIVLQPGGKILLVEDDPITTAVIQHRLGRDGHDLVHFSDGIEALEWVTESNPALVILDVKLPGMDGFELLQRIKERRQLAHVPIVIVSGMGREEDVLRGLKLGADEYIVKPFSTNELSARVHRALRKGGRAENPASVAS